MRLKQIKLSGFKSFADPTAFQVPSQLVGVVGPNGCGKSNVIDAVRWVLGESKASELRGESMQDVIFNGASDRKAAARASVELVFDNSLGRIGGHWANYAELSVRRTLSRDNQSVYQINNQAVRRRDVHDMFLGTGLGPRAYAIIGQGTISRIIEAKPEELRVFLEEAAGVSKYKERRRETESRLASTRENLSRVDDIDRELGSRIDKLLRQAQVAASYRDMDDERSRNARMQWIVKRNDAQSSQQKLMLTVEAARTEYEARTADLRALENRIEALRQQVDQAGDDTHGAQGGFYEANAEVARLEAEIRRIGDARESLEQNLVRLRAERDVLQQRDAQTRTQQTDDQQRLQELDLSFVGGEEQVEQHRERLALAEQAEREATEALDASRHAQADNRRAAESLLIEQRSNDERLQALERRLARARAEQAALPAADAASLARVLASLASLTSGESVAQQRLESVQEQWTSLEEQRVPAQEALRAAQASHAQIDARAGALRELQNRLDKQNDMHEWLASRGMGDLQPLWQRLRIDDGWEVAVENVLRERVSAIEVNDLSRAVPLADDSLPAKLVLFSAGEAASPEGALPAGLRPLLSVVRSGDAAVQNALREWLRGYYVAESLPAAHAARADLAPGAAFIVRDGHRVSRHAVQLFAADNEHEGVLQRQHELDNLEREGRAQSLLLDEAREHAQRVERSAAELAAQLTSARADHARLAREMAAAQVLAQRSQQQADQIRLDVQRIGAEVAECAEEMGPLQARQSELAQSLTLLDEAAEPLTDALDDGRQALADAQAHVSESRTQLRSAEHAAQAARYQSQSLREQLERHERSLTENAERCSQLEEQIHETDTRRVDLQTDALDEQREQALQVQAQRQEALGLARQRQEDLAGTLREAEQQRLTIERDREPLNQRVTELILKEQAARLAIEQCQEQLDEAGVDHGIEQTLVKAFERPPSASWLQGEIVRLNRAIEALGPVNLAALDELQESQERKGFLESQSADLREAIATLEDAIHRIDLETRMLLQGTFDSVNSQFGTLFPELFGGGDAKLVLTGDEILDAGVQVMAHPPGKRNSSIHLLSGGEKALTAIALVFALFHLNPAPFCLLDEVDAPLDDANTERYRNMVKRMSAQTQFLFITHNKIAMEMAEQLVGVTMQERGVSRIVAVDLDRAAEFAQAA